HLDDRNTCEGQLEIHHRHVVRACVSREEVSPAIAALAKSEKFRVGPTAEPRVGCQEGNHRRRCRRNEWDWKVGTWVRRMSQSHLDLSSTTTRFPIDEADAI